MTFSELLVKMGTIVNGYMESYQSDFYVHDTTRLYEDYEHNDDDASFMWFIYNNGTGLFFPNELQCGVSRNFHNQGYYRRYSIEKKNRKYTIERID